MPNDDPQAILDSCKRAAAILTEAKVPFAIGGGIACWCYGAPESDHDVDIMLREEDARGAQELLATHGMKPVDPPEDWLVKVYDGDVLIDLIFRPEGLPITDEVIERAPVRDVNAMKMRVLRLEDVFVTKLLSYNEHHLDFLGLLAVARAVREQVDWQAVSEAVDHSPFAAAFLTLVERLGIVAEPLRRAG
ncbi:MAG TPA: nucleotidyltransferase [Mycobacteriales bacterium]|nr:nucleotidyltransferase [Mycobacteriales bacterium]